MSKIELGQFSSFLRRYLGMSGVSHVADELAPEISPILTLESERAEWEFLKGAKLMTAPIVLAGAAAQVSAVKLRNPAASGVVAVFGAPFGPLLEISHDTPVVDSVILRLFQQAEAADLTTSIAPIPRDTRIPVVAASTSAIVGSQTNNLGATTLGAILANIVVLDKSPYKFEASFVLTPGNELSLTSPEVNVTLIGTFYWLEKRLDQLQVS